MYHIKEVAKISGVSVRTLHHYDEVGLLVPEKGDNNYRLYNESDINKLQQILFYKVLGFKLNDIKRLLQDNEVNRLESLLRQKELLKIEKENLERLLITIEKTIIDYQGGKTMTINEKFDGFNKENFGIMYEDEAKEKYGEFAVENAKNNINEEVFNKWLNIFKSLEKFKTEGLNVENKQVQEQIALLYNNFNEYVFDCSLEVFAGIGKMYVNDERFKTNIDKVGQGTAQYLSDAIAYYTLNKD